MRKEKGGNAISPPRYPLRDIPSPISPPSWAARLTSGQRHISWRSGACILGALKSRNAARSEITGGGGVAELGEKRGKMILDGISCFSFLPLLRCPRNSIVLGVLGFMRVSKWGKVRFCSPRCRRFTGRFSETAVVTAGLQP